jgi:cobalt/nickel transport system ATP-binding protein
MKPVLEVEYLAYGYDHQKPVLHDITFSIVENESVGIVGGNGAGKSTLIWCVLGLLKAHGKIRLFGNERSTDTRSRVGVVFQNSEDMLFMPMLLDDLILPLVNRGWSKNQAIERALQVLDQLGLRSLAHRPAGQFSLGERKRASIASALVGFPELLVLDEPTAELDGRAARQLTSILKNLPVARLITSHHLDFLRETTSRVLVLSSGTLVAEGPSDDILSNDGLLQQAGLI